jgi:hypothetical protein
LASDEFREGEEQTDPKPLGFIFGEAENGFFQKLSYFVKIC